MAAQLAAHGWPALTRLLDRRALLDSVRAGNLGFMAAGAECSSRSPRLS